MTAVDDFLAPQPAAATATDMARRLLAVAEELQKFGIKPSSLAVGYGYMWGYEGNPSANDMVSVQLDAEDFVRFAAWSLLGRTDYDRDEAGGITGNVYASGYVVGVAVMVFANALQVFDIDPAEVSA